MAERALELLALPEEKLAFLLDIGLQLIPFSLFTTALAVLPGCGTGISGGVLADNGHCWVGMDISKHMLSKVLLEKLHGSKSFL